VDNYKFWFFDIERRKLNLICVNKSFCETARVRWPPMLISVTFTVAAQWPKQWLWSASKESVESAYNQRLISLQGNIREFASGGYIETIPSSLMLLHHISAPLSNRVRVKDLGIRNRDLGPIATLINRHWCCKLKIDSHVNLYNSNNIHTYKKRLVIKWLW
jgi:hypothetical protein